MHTHTTPPPPHAPRTPRPAPLHPHPHPHPSAHPAPCSGKWEAHIWSPTTGKQLYLGSWQIPELAALAYDAAALRQRGPSDTALPPPALNYHPQHYEGILPQLMRHSVEQVVAALRKLSKGGAARQSSAFRGVTRHAKVRAGGRRPQGMRALLVVVGPWARIRHANNPPPLPCVLQGRWEVRIGAAQVLPAPERLVARPPPPPGPAPLTHGKHPLPHP